MDAAVDNSDVLIKFMPSLRHLSLVKVGLQLLLEFDMDTLNKVFKEILPEYSPGVNEGNLENLEEESKKADEISRNRRSMKVRDLLWSQMVLKVRRIRFLAREEENPEVNYNRAKENFLFIPSLFRMQVLETVLGLYYSFQDWRDMHSHILKLNDIKSIYFRSDGTIDRCKTAEQLVWNENIELQKRFHLACYYCMEESVKVLWTELDAASSETCFEPIVAFWVEWLRGENRAPWVYTLPDFRRGVPLGKTFARRSLFYPNFSPAQRRRFFTLLCNISIDDAQFCLSAITQEERDFIMKHTANFFLRDYLKWPLQSLFLDTADRLWIYMDDIKFVRLLGYFFEFKNTKKDYNYSKLFVEFWRVAPNHLKENAMKVIRLRVEIESCLNER